MAAPDLAYPPMAAVAGNPGQLRGLATELQKLVSYIDARETTISKSAKGSSAYWAGDAGDAYRRAMDEHLTPYRRLHREIVPVIRRACVDLAQGLSRAQDRMTYAIALARAIPVSPAGMPMLPTTLDRLLFGAVCWRGGPEAGQGLVSSDTAYWVKYANPYLIKVFLQQQKQTEAYLQPLVNHAALAFKTAREARRAFVTAVGGARSALATLLYGPPSAAERAVDASVGRGANGSWITGLQWLFADKTPDPEGRIIAYRYGHPYQANGVVFTEDATWVPYLMRNGILQREVRSILTDAVRNAMEHGRTTFDVRRNMSIDNGYDTGYQLLHGTEATVGDFHVTGNLRRVADGMYEVTATYTWNDIIDPNDTYLLDTLGNLAAGGGKAYNMHITWTRTTTVKVDPSGTTIQGWPQP